MTVQIKRIGRSKLPLIHQLPAMADNLAKILKFDYAKVSVESINYGHDPANFRYEIALQPGLDGDTCSIHYFYTWPECQDFYFKLIEGK